MNMSNNLSYTQTGDYLLPNLTLHQPKTPLGKYGRMRGQVREKIIPGLRVTQIVAHVHAGSFHCFGGGWSF